MSGDAPDPDDQVAAQLQRGDGGAIEALYDRYGRLALGVAYRILNDRTAAEDAVQEAFVAVWRNGAGFDPSRGGLRNWLLSIVRNRAIDRLRGSAKVRAEVRLESTDPAGGVPDPWAALAIDLERKQIREAFGELSEAQRRTLSLAFFAGLTQVEIAQQMRVPLGTVKGRMRIGLEKMRAFLLARGVTV